MHSTRNNNGSNVSNRMKGPMSMAMSQPRRATTNASQSQLDPNWQSKVGSSSRFQPSSVFVPRQGGGSQNTGRGGGMMGVASKGRPANAFDAKAFLRTQRKGEFLNSNKEQQPMQQQQQQSSPFQRQQQAQQMQQQQQIGTNVAKFDINAFKRSAPRVNLTAQEQSQQPTMQQQHQPVQQRVQPVQQQQTVQQRVQPVQQQHQPVQQRAQPAQQSQQPAQQRQAAPAAQQQRQAPQQRQRVAPQEMPPTQQIAQEEAGGEEDDDQLPWQSATQNVANRIQKGTSSKVVLDQIAAMRQAAATEQPPHN